MILDRLRAGCDEAEGGDWTVSADSTINRAHQHGTGAPRAATCNAPTGATSNDTTAVPTVIARLLVS